MAASSRAAGDPRGKGVRAPWRGVFQPHLLHSPTRGWFCLVFGCEWGRLFPREYYSSAQLWLRSMPPLTGAAPCSRHSGWNRFYLQWIFGWGAGGVGGRLECHTRATWKGKCTPGPENRLFLLKEGIWNIGCVDRSERNHKKVIHMDKRPHIGTSRSDPACTVSWEEHGTHHSLCALLPAFSPGEGLRGAVTFFAAPATALLAHASPWELSMCDPLI